LKQITSDEESVMQKYEFSSQGNNFLNSNADLEQGYYVGCRATWRQSRLLPESRRCMVALGGTELLSKVADTTWRCRGNNASES
jgi:hypothetical protein